MGKMITIGITGSLASGKTTVANMFLRKGVAVLNADNIAHLALRKNTRAYKALLESFGSDIIVKNGIIDRKKLAAIAFKNKKNQNTLCAIVHPWVCAYIKDKISAYRNSKKVKAVVVEAVLLIEAGLERLMDINIVVRSNLKQQIQRVGKRGMSPADARKRLRFQMPFCEKIAHADYVIDNRGTFKSAKLQVERILKAVFEKR